MIDKYLNKTSRMSENRKCVNCRHRILSEGNVSSFCEIDGHFIHYADVFEGWCRHWAKQKDRKKAKFLFLDDLNQTKSENTKINTEAIEEWWQRGQLFIHGDNEPEAVTNCGTTTVDIETMKKAIEKYFENMVRKENEK